MSATNLTRERALTVERTKLSKEGLATGMHLLGLESKNGYKYTTEALKGAVSLYNNVDVYSNHLEDDATPRKQEDKIGFIVGEARYVADKGLVGDVQFNIKHPNYPAIVWWMENAPSKLGFSHYALLQHTGPSRDVTKIAKVASVDLVAEPATTSGMFAEGIIGDAVAADINSRRLCDLVCKAYAMMMDAVYPIQANLTDREKALMIMPIVEDLEAELERFNPDATAADDAAMGNPVTKPSGVTNPAVQASEGNKMDIKTLTLDDLRKDRADLVIAIANEAVAGELSVIAAVTEAVKPVDAKLHSKVFMRLVTEAIRAKNTDALAELIADRKSLVIEAPVSGMAAEAVKPAAKQTEQKRTLTDDEIIAAFK